LVADVTEARLLRLLARLALDTIDDDRDIGGPLSLDDGFAREPSLPIIDFDCA
jgi:hypothetical protein